MRLRTLLALLMVMVLCVVQLPVYSATQEEGPYSPPVDALINRCYTEGINNLTRLN